MNWSFQKKSITYFQAKLTYAHQQIPRMQNEELNVDHHILGNQQPSNTKSEKHFNNGKLNIPLLRHKSNCTRHWDTKTYLNKEISIVFKATAAQVQALHSS